MAWEYSLAWDTSVTRWRRPHRRSPPARVSSWAASISIMPIGTMMPWVRGIVWACDGPRSRAPPAELGARGPAPAGVGPDRRPDRAGGDVCDEHRGAVSGARGHGGSPHSPEAARDRPAGSQSQDCIGAAPAARARTRG